MGTDQNMSKLAPKTERLTLKVVDQSCSFRSTRNTWVPLQADSAAFGKGIRKNSVIFVGEEVLLRHEITASGHDLT